MSDTDLLNDLLMSDPNEPATKGLLLLMRAETKSEFKKVHIELKTIKSEIVDIHTKIDKMDRSIEFIAQQITKLVDRMG